MNSAEVPPEETGAVIAAVIVAEDDVDEATVVTTCGATGVVCWALLGTGAVDVGTVAATDVGVASLGALTMDSVLVRLAFDESTGAGGPKADVLVDIVASTVVDVLTVVAVVRDVVVLKEGVLAAGGSVVASCVIMGWGAIC